MTREKLISHIFEKGSYLIVGLDTDIDKIPKHLLTEVDPIFSFNKEIIDATKDHCVGYKLNTAFYESMGSSGWESMKKTVEYIGNDHFTISPYMGEDSVRPFLQYPNKWGIVLGLTSNIGARDFELELYESVLQKVSEWGTTENLMFVIGATRVANISNIRKITPHHFYLVPGIGAQGGSLKEISEKMMIKDCGILVNVSRSIIYASSDYDFAEIAKEVASSYHKEMSEYLKKSI